MTSDIHFGRDGAQAWLGVALALDETPSGRAAYRVKLWPLDDAAAALCLFETFESQEAIAQWRLCALQYGLPKYIERIPGAVEATTGGPLPAPRRRGAALTSRRHSHLGRRGQLLTPAAPAN